DIILGGNPETMAWAQLQHKYPTRLEVPDEEWNALVNEIDELEGMKAEGELVRSIGGLAVLGTERHESRRIDLQLRGRCGRQGDPGSSRFFLSLEDDLMRIFAGDFVKSMMERLGMKEGEAIESRVVTGRIASAQKKVEERNYEIRKSLLDYDEVMDEQRKRIYRYRQNLLDGHSSRSMILDLIRGQISKFVETFLDPKYAVESFAAYAGGMLDCQLEPRDFLTMDFEMASSYAHNQAERQVEVAVAEIVEENLPEGMEEEWNWKALTNWSNTRQGSNFQEHQLKRLDRDELINELIRVAHARVEKVDLKEGAVMLEADFGLKTLSAWMQHKFGIETQADEFKDVEDLQGVTDALAKRAEDAYSLKEAEYPILTGLSRFTTKQGAQASLDREGLVEWVARRFDVSLSIEDVKMNREELKQQLVQFSREANQSAQSGYEAARDKVETLFGDAGEETTAAVASNDESLDALIKWLDESFSHQIAKEDLSRMNRQQLSLAVDGAVDDRFYPEMRRMERQVLLQIVDEAWKNHLLTMDHLRSSVGLKGYAQMDPKVEYKREGMRLFEKVWESIGERVTDLIFRMESSLNEAFIRSTWVEGQTRHDEVAPPASPSSAGAANANTSTNSSSQSSEPQKPATIRNRGRRVGRNDPCPCGSGKKYKNCCMLRNV
ncbi:MAG: SEC-C metal-binding domain-containing protein, partial [Planctomycetota bacterium]|nr:SEC-C metal-binding domain-containing protein [Planctomycetota bacterium]